MTGKKQGTVTPGYRLPYSVNRTGAVASVTPKSINSPYQKNRTGALAKVTPAPMATPYPASNPGGRIPIGSGNSRRSVSANSSNAQVDRKMSPAKGTNAGVTHLPGLDTKYAAGLRNKRK